MNLYVFVYLLVVILLDTFVLCTKRFIGNEISDVHWNSVLEEMTCFSTMGMWRNSSYVKSLRSMNHCTEISTIPHTFETDKKCRIEQGVSHIYHTGSNCKGIKYHLSIERFCEIIDGKNISFVGDSINELFFLHLVNQLYSTMSTHSTTSCYCSYNCVKDAYNIKTFIPCSNYMKTKYPHIEKVYKDIPMYFYRNDLLHNDTNLKFNLADMLHKSFHNDMTPWTNAIVNYPGLVIINRGAHALIDNQLYIKEIDETFNWLKHNLDLNKTTVIFRSTNVGHVNYISEFYNEPLIKPNTILNEIAQGYGFHLFDEMNQLVQNLIKTKYPEFLYLNTYDMSLLRHDHLENPLHYCKMEGPLTGWTDLLFQLIHLMGIGMNQQHTFHNHLIKYIDTLE